MSYLIDGQSGLLKSWGSLGADIHLTAVTAFEVKDQRKLSTYAGAWGGFDVMTGIGPTERVLTVKGRVSNDIRARDATAYVRATLDKLMESQEPVAYVSPVASIPRGVLIGVTIVQAGVTAIDVELTIRAVRTVEAESVAGEKAPARSKKGSGKDVAAPKAPASKASKPAAAAPEKSKSLLLRMKDSGSESLTELSNWLKK